MHHKFHKGSEWRKWDLHLHSPCTKLSDAFKLSESGEIWDVYCLKLYDSDVQAFGIADYFSADGYLATLREYNARYPNSHKVFFPNIELRTSYVVNRAHEEVNVHLIFNPFQPDHERKIISFLDTLETNKTDASDRHIKASELRTEHDYESATTTRESINNALKATYGSGADLLDFVLIVTAANNDGIRAVPGKQRKAQIADELDKFSNAFFGNKGSVEYFLGTYRAEDKEVYTQPKPVLSGCDAHSFSDLDGKLGQVVYSSTDGIVHEPTWIKADLTFEGLKQIVFEPQNRVFIGEEPEAEQRVRANKTQYIKSLHISCVDGYRADLYGVWFHDETIELGKELVAIIGNKGSGKSAVTDIIGLLGNSHNQTSSSASGRSDEQLFSFLNKEKFLKGGCASHFQATLNWHGGEPDTKLLSDDVDKSLPEQVEYLPQKYLERICADIADDEFRATLNEVIFRYVPDQDRHGKENLDDLMKYLMSQAQIDIDQMKAELHGANDSVVDIEKKLTADYKKALEEKIKRKKDDLEEHNGTKPEEKQKPVSDSGASAEQAKELEQLTQRIDDISEQVNQLISERIAKSALLEKLRQVRQSINRAATALNDLEAEHGEVLESAGIDFGQIVKLVLNFTPLDEAITEREQRLEEIKSLLLSAHEIAEINGDIHSNVEAARKAAIEASLTFKKETLEAQKVELVEKMAKPEREYQQYLAELRLWEEREKELSGDVTDPGKDTLNWLVKELQKLDEDYPNHLREAREERRQISKEIFSKKKKLTRFYNNVKRPIDTEISKCREQLGDYDISIDAELRLDPDFFTDFLRFINQNIAGSFRGTHEGIAMLHQFTDAVTNWENESHVFEVLSKINDALHTDRRDGCTPQNAKRDVFKQMVSGKTPKDLYDYLYGFDYLEPKYDLKVDAKDLSELSPGERGGLLLIFYLMLDQRKIPLIIDQPEDNLDNMSVYKILVEFIKQAKKRRQIILVTHNPNLAVVADAEQIIYVSIDKKNRKHDFDFVSGSIENPEIKEKVVDILEGTLPAFDNRRLKYKNRNWRMD